MIRTLLLSALQLSLCLTAASAQPGTVNMTPVVSGNLEEVSIEVPPKFIASFPANHKLFLPQGHKVRVFYAGGLSKPRFMAFDPQGVLHVSDMGNGKIYALPDANRDGIADTAIVVSQGYTNNHDVKFYKGNMYVTETTKVWKCTDADHDGIYESKVVFIDNIGGGGTNGHITRTIVFDSLNQKMYLSIGSSCNVCRESNRAIIEQYNDDGTGRRTYASGIRNAVGMALHPVTNRLWANNNGSDYQGNEVPPEWISTIVDGGFYGHPFAYGNQVWFNFDVRSDYQALKPITAADSARVQQMSEPAALIRAHSAPMALAFSNASFGPLWHYGFFTALHGSWNTTTPNDFRGYKVIYADLTNGQDTTVNGVADFCTGFLTDTVNRTYWGRPVGLAADNNGNLYVSSDETNMFILQVYDDTPTGIYQPPRNVIAVHNTYPNPFSTSFTVPFTLTERSAVSIILYDMLGREVKNICNETLDAGEYRREAEAANAPKGVYLLQIKAGEQTYVQKITCVK